MENWDAQTHDSIASWHLDVAKRFWALPNLISPVLWAKTFLARWEALTIMLKYTASLTLSTLSTNLFLHFLSRSRSNIRSAMRSTTTQDSLRCIPSSHQHCPNSQLLPRSALTKDRFRVHNPRQVQRTTDNAGLLHNWEHGRLNPFLLYVHDSCPTRHSRSPQDWCTGRNLSSPTSEVLNHRQGILLVKQH